MRSAECTERLTAYSRPTVGCAVLDSAVQQSVWCRRRRKETCSSTSTRSRRSLRAHSSSMVPIRITHNMQHCTLVIHQRCHFGLHTYLTAALFVVPQYSEYSYCTYWRKQQLSKCSRRTHSIYITQPCSAVQWSIAQFCAQRLYWRVERDDGSSRLH